ncbi:N-formylglutamate amidohydrolase [Burkholderia sp. Ac-20353]|uniref:N-formylglutamate amidohydrolase n=1 Tax=Burkholderia sp. Ac-20353 TaxID=2703894 RepID=UPI00197C4E9D|nr:N-formylglutamate amidohydrolase [Burkholderia sp. Ac-20353]MBN3785819.1 N-formylglutamate amidohydrolase [Burkholderia sp. Ac-20353]
MHDEAGGQIYRGDGPILVAAPHVGTAIPEELTALRAWQAVRKTRVDPGGTRLQEAAVARGISCIAARMHPCVIDVNMVADRPSAASELGRSALCRPHSPLGESLYSGVAEPSEGEVMRRVRKYWTPYHETLATELKRLRDIHDDVLLVVSHASSRLSPYQRQSGAADCNVGTNRGRSCDKLLVSTLTKSVRSGGRSWVVNGKLADSFAAQHYGMPAAGIHVVELEVAGKWREDCEAIRVGESTASEFGVLLGNLLDALSTLTNADGA